MGKKISSLFDSDYPNPLQTRVVNIKTWSLSPYDVYIGRAGHGESGTFGNPIERNKPCPECGQKHFDNASIVKCYKIFLANKLEVDIEFRNKVKGLAGKTLGCFCKPQACHGDVLAWMADYLTQLERNGEEFNLYLAEPANYLGINPGGM